MRMGGKVRRAGIVAVTKKHGKTLRWHVGVGNFIDVGYSEMLIRRDQRGPVIYKLPAVCADRERIEALTKE